MPLYQQHSFSSVFRFLFSVTMQLIRGCWHFFLACVLAYAKVIELLAKGVSFLADEILKITHSPNQ